MKIAPLPDLKDKLIRTRAQSTHGSQRLKMDHKKKFTSLDHDANTSLGNLSQCADLKSSIASIVIEDPVHQHTIEPDALVPKRQNSVKSQFDLTFSGKMH